MIGTAFDMRCLYCGRPILGPMVYGVEGPYHPSCVEPPEPRPNFYSSVPAWDIEMQELRRRIEKLEELLKGKDV